MRGSVDMNFLFTLGEVQRMSAPMLTAGGALRHHPRAWAVLAKVERNEG